MSRVLAPSQMIVRTTLSVSMALAAFSLVFSGLPAKVLVAQAPAQQRIVQGKVTDKGDALLKGAVVYLKDGHTLSVKSYISTEDGSFRFGQLAQSTDYQVWAELNGKKSPTKSISSFDSRNEFNLTLKIDTTK